jgi:hypothetical protein
MPDPLTRGDWPVDRIETLLLEWEPIPARKPIALSGATMTRDDDRPLALDLSERKPAVLNVSLPWEPRKPTVELPTAEVAPCLPKKP